MPDHFLSGPRLHALLGDAMHDLPPGFTEKLERMLEENGTPLPATSRVVHLSSARKGKPEQVAAPAGDGGAHATGSLVGLAAVLGAMRNVRQEQRDGGVPWDVAEQMVDGLLMASQVLAAEAQDALPGAQ